MSKFTVLIRANPSGGFSWKIIADGKTIKSGTTATEFEARTVADGEIKELENEGRSN